MWRYRIGFTMNELGEKLGKDVSFEDVCSFFKEQKLSFSYDIPENIIRSAVPSIMNAEYRKLSTMRIEAPLIFSCSSLVSYLYVLAGIWMPSISVDKFVFGKMVTREELIYGDLIFSNSRTGRIYTETVEWQKGTSVPEGVDHVGMYLGNNLVLHASKPADGIAIEEIDKSIAFENIVGFRRIADLSTYRFVVFLPDEMTAQRNVGTFIQWMSENL